MSVRKMKSAIVLALLTAPVGSAGWCADAPAGDAAHGRSLFVTVGCYECHGRVGQGGAFNYAAPPLAHIAIPLEGFKVLVRMGLNDMPAYKEQVLSDQDVADIHAYLSSLPGPSAAKDFPLLNQ
jgi:mono/diheme cytochrome c family protein